VKLTLLPSTRLRETRRAGHESLLTRRLPTDRFFQIRHLHRRQRSFESLISHFQSGTVDSLLQSVAGQHAESMRNTRLLGGLPDSARDLVDDDIVVGSVTAKKAAETNDRVVLFGFGESTRRGRNFKGTRDANQIDILAFCAATRKAIECALKKSFGNKRIKAGDYDGETLSSTAELALEGLHLNLGQAVRRWNFCVLFLRDSMSPAELQKL